MKEIVFIHSCDIEDPKRGTPIRIRSILEELRKNRDLDVRLYNGINKTTVQKFKELRDRPERLLFGNTHQDFWALVLCKLFARKKIIIDLHGSVEEELYADGSISLLKKWVLSFLYKNALRVFNGVSVVNSILKKELLSYQREIVVTYPGIDLSSIPAVSHLDDHDADHPMRFGYVGNANAYQGTDVVLRAAKRLRDEGALFRLVMICSEQKRMSKLIQDTYGDLDQSIEVYYGLPHEEAIRAIGSCDVLMILRPDNRITQLSFPTKLPEYFATGRTMIVTDFGDIRSVLRDREDAYVISTSQRDEESYQLMKRMISGELPLLDPVSVRRNCEKKFSWNVIMQPLNELLSRL